MRMPVAVAAVFVLVVPVSEGAESATRIIDRTLVCQTTGVGAPDPIRFLDVAASPVERRASPMVSISNGPVGAAGVTIGANTGPGWGRPTGAAWLTLRRCTATRQRLPLASTGLRSAQPGPFGKRFTCEVPARLMVRLRAVFTRPTTVVRDPRFPWLSVARGRITSVYLAVRTVNDRPIVFASASDTTGKARAFVAASRCFEK